jgi:hypothetical protein|nr:MAG TPA: hypothetical protein [Caudoviricetes sp.]
MENLIVDIILLIIYISGFIYSMKMMINKLGLWFMCPFIFLFVLIFSLPSWITVLFLKLFNKDD